MPVSLPCLQVLEDYFLIDTFYLESHLEFSIYTRIKCFTCCYGVPALLQEGHLGKVQPQKSFVLVSLGPLGPRCSGELRTPTHGPSHLEEHTAWHAQFPALMGSPSGLQGHPGTWLVWDSVSPLESSGRDSTGHRHGTRQTAASYEKPSITQPCL